MVDVSRVGEEEEEEGGGGGGPRRESLFQGGWKHLKDVPQELVEPEAALGDLARRLALRLSVLREKMSLVEVEDARIGELKRAVEEGRKRAEEVKRLRAEEEGGAEAMRKTAEELRLKTEAVEEEEEEEGGVGDDMALYDDLERLKKEAVRAERRKAEKKEKMLKYRDVLLGKAWYFKRYLGVHVALGEAEEEGGRGKRFVVRFGGREAVEAVVLASDGFKEWRVLEMSGVPPDDLEKKAFDLEETDNLLALLAAARKTLLKAPDILRCPSEIAHDSNT